MTNAQLELLNALLEGRSIILGCIQQYLNSNKNNQIAYLTPIDQISHLFLSSEINLSELLKNLSFIIITLKPFSRELT